MDALVAPVPAVDAASWRSALEEAKTKLAGLAVRRAGAVRFRVTDHEVRTAFTIDDALDLGPGQPFAWTSLTARRSIGVAAVRLMLAGSARSPSRRCGTGWPNPPAGYERAVPPPPSWIAGLTVSPRPVGPPSARKP